MWDSYESEFNNTGVVWKLLLYFSNFKGDSKEHAKGGTLLDWNFNTTNDR